MKRIIALFLLALFAAPSGTGAEKPDGVAMKVGPVSVSFLQHPVQADPKALPLIEVATAGKEKFGVQLGGIPASSPVVEILDGQGIVLRALSVNDLVGKGVSKETRLLPPLKPRKAEAVYTVRFQEQDARLFVRCLVAGNDGSPDQRLVVTFALRTEHPTDKLALRLKLPVAGTVEETSGGFLILSKNGSTGAAASVLPGGVVSSVQKGRITLTSASVPLRASTETPMLWLVISAVAQPSAAGARAEAARLVHDSSPAAGEPRVVVVTASDRENLTQADTATYFLFCTNIGTGDAADVVLSNPIPKGARYVPGSATRADLTLREETSGTGVSGLKWIAARPLLPGEERVVTFRVTVRE